MLNFLMLLFCIQCYVVKFLMTKWRLFVVFDYNDLRFIFAVYVLFSNDSMKIVLSINVFHTLHIDEIFLFIFS